MRVDPEYAAVGKFFQTQQMFKVPKYQRGYAWEKDETDDFVQDLERLYHARKSGQPKNHFMGGIVSVEHKLVGGVSRHWHELVDGQQRMATFVLLATSILRNYEKLIETAKQQGDSESQRIAEKRKENLFARFIEFELGVNRITSIKSVMELSKSDNPFFVELVRNRRPVKTRDSHERLQNAYDKILKKTTLLSENTDLSQYLDNLEFLEQILMKISAF